MLSKAQRAWLEKLRDEGTVEKRPRGRLAMECMRAGLTEWDAVDLETGAEVPAAAVVDAIFRRGGRIKIIGERITEAGRRALEEQNDD